MKDTEEFSVPQLWDGRLIYVGRSSHDCGTIVPQLWDAKYEPAKRKTYKVIFIKTWWMFKNISISL